jgi:hypothetical protein
VAGPFSFPGRAFPLAIGEDRAMNSIPEADSAREPALEMTRPVTLTILLLVVFAVNALGLMRGIAAHDRLVQEIPGFTPPIFATWTAAQAAAVIGAIGLWLRFRFGLWMLALAWVCTAVVDVRLGATGHSIIATGVFGLVLLFVRPWRPALR